MVVAQDVYPGASVYHAGWYNALLVALLVLAALEARKAAGRALPALIGTALLVAAGAACGLTGPETQTLIGAPGTSVRNSDFGTIAFPLDARPSGRWYTPDAIFRQKPRTVVHVDVTDLRGGHLTITQPTSESFLSPVLLMAQSTTIAGMRVAFDTFSVPEAARTVKAVLFTGAQTARLRVPPEISGNPAVLFAVSDEADRPVPGGIVLVGSGERRRADGLILGARIEEYPAYVASSAPFLPLLILGLGLILSGIAPRSRFRS
jgi:cell division septation protein DedD